MKSNSQLQLLAARVVRAICAGTVGARHRFGEGNDEGHRAILPSVRAAGPGVACRSRVWLKLLHVNPPTDPAELARTATRLAALRLEHRDLDAAIARLQVDIQADELAVKRLKKRKLQLKDQISRLESDLIPDQPA